MCYAPRRMKTRYLVWLLLPAVALPGCAMTKKILGIRDPGEPSVVIKSAETRWLLIKNPRFGDVASEPEYVWVEEDKVPTTMYQTAEPSKAAAANRGGSALAAAPTRATASITPTPVSPAPAPKPPERGYVVYVDSARVVIDLTNLDGLRPGTVLSLRRDRIPIVHPVTGELLGELDEEVATARVTEIRDRFSVAEVQSLAPGAQVQVRDRVVLK